MKGYGWLNPKVFRNFHSNAGGSGSAVLKYDYGWPGGGSSENNVTFQLLFDESSSPIVDEVAAVSLAQVGAPTYQVDTSAYSDLMALGSTIAFNQGWRKDSTTSEVAPGTQSWVYECVYKANSPNGEMIDTRDPGSVDVGGWYVGLSGASNGVTIIVTSTDNVTVGKTFTDATVFDGNFHKMRAVFDRSGNLELFVDGESQGTQSLATISGKTIPAHGLTIGQRATGLNTAIGTYNEIRVSIGTTTNNSGGPGGG